MHDVAAPNPDRPEPATASKAVENRRRVAAAAPPPQWPGASAAPRVAAPADPLAGMLARAVQQRAAAADQPQRDGNARGEPDGDELDTNGMFDVVESAFTGALGGDGGTDGGGGDGGTDGGKHGATTAAAKPCAATATGVSLGTSSASHEPDDDRYGLITPIIVRGTHLGDVQETELVSESLNHTGSMTAKPTSKSGNSGYMAADAIPPDRHQSSISDHLSYFDNHGGAGCYDYLQMDLYKIPTCGINTGKDMPNSGYRIRRRVKAEGKKVVGIITKTAEAVTIAGHSSTAGLTAKKQAKVTLRG